MYEPQWQPIETAPKDGRDILIWTGLKAMVVCWNALDQRIDGTLIGCWTDGNTVDFEADETEGYLWMEIPPI